MRSRGIADDLDAIRSLLRLWKPAIRVLFGRLARGQLLGDPAQRGRTCPLHSAVDLLGFGLAQHVHYETVAMRSLAWLLLPSDLWGAIDGPVVHVCLRLPAGRRLSIRATLPFSFASAT
jgi:hypothetical protein